MGTEALALCIAGDLCERDPSLLAAFQERVHILYRILDDRGDHEGWRGERWRSVGPVEECDLPWENQTLRVLGWQVGNFFVETLLCHTDIVRV